MHSHPAYSYSFISVFFLVFFFFGNLDKEIFACMKTAAGTCSLLAHYVGQEKENNKGKVFH